MPFGNPNDRAAGGPHSSDGEDILRSAHSGLIQGVSGLAGTLGDLRQAGEQAAQWVGDKAGIKNLPSFQPPLPVRALGAAVNGIAKAAHVDPAAARLAMALTSPGGLGGAPTSGELQHGVTHGKPLYEPQTKAGQYARTIAQFAPAVTSPGGAVRRVASAVVPAVLSETAGQVTHDKAPELEPYARLAGALVGAGGVGVGASGSPRTRILAQASRGASDAQVAQAGDLMRTAQQHGVQLTMAEALQQVTNGGTGMGRMQRVLEATPAGTERIAPVMAQRPQAVRNAVLTYADDIAPATDNPSMVGARAQSAAEGGLDDTRRFVNWGAQPHYDALVGQTLPDAEFQQLRQNPSFAAALGDLRSNPELNASIAHLPDNDLSVINEVQKRIQGMAEAARPSPVNPGGNNQLAAVRGTAAGQVEQAASQASPDWRAARDAVSAGRQAYLEPLQRGPLGEIASTPDVGAQTKALFPSRPLEGAPNETAQALHMLATQGADIGPALTRQHLVNAVNEATQDNVGGPNQWGGAKYAATIAGNPEQERTLMAGVGAAGGDTNRLDSILEVLRATGQRERPGSPTATNIKAFEEMGKAGAVGEVLRTGLNPPGIFRRLGEGFQDWQTERNAGRLADAIIANPDQAEQIVMHARQVVPPGAALNNITQVGVAAQLARQQQLAAPSNAP